MNLVFQIFFYFFFLTILIWNLNNQKYHISPSFAKITGEMRTDLTAILICLERSFLSSDYLHKLKLDNIADHHKILLSVLYDVHHIFENWPLKHLRLSMKVAALLNT